MPDKKAANLEHDTTPPRSLADIPVERLCATKDIDRDLLEDELRRRFEESKLD